MANMTNNDNIANQEQCWRILEAKGIKLAEEIDGSAEDKRELRNQLFSVDGAERGVYPQFYSRDGDEYTFICNGTNLDTWNDQESALLEAIEKDPDFLSKEGNEGYKLIKDLFK